MADAMGGGGGVIKLHCFKKYIKYVRSGPYWAISVEI